MSAKTVLSTTLRANYPFLGVITFEDCGAHTPNHEPSDSPPTKPRGQRAYLGRYQASSLRLLQLTSDLSNNTTINESSHLHRLHHDLSYPPRRPSSRKTICLDVQAAFFVIALEISSCPKLPPSQAITRASNRFQSTLNQRSPKHAHSNIIRLFAKAMIQASDSRPCAHASRPCYWSINRRKGSF